MDQVASLSLVDNDEEETAFHPLYNPLILKSIFKVLPLDALKECRLVSTLWNHLASSEVRKLAWISLTHDEGFKFGLVNFFNFVETTYSSPDEILFQNYKIKFMNLSNTTHEKTRMKEFWKNYGPQIKSLYMKRCCMDKGMFGQIISPEWTPNLEELILDECPFMLTKDAGAGDHSDVLILSSNRIRVLRFISDKSEYTQPFDLNHLWSMFPHLQDLHLTDMTEDETTQILEASAKRRKEKKMAFQLSKLDIFGEEKYSIRRIPHHNFELLCMSGFPLTRLQIDIGEQIQESQFELLLKAFSRTLETLIIWRGLLAHNIKGFPFAVNLPRLRTLAIPESCVEDFSFIKYTRDLRTFTLRQCDLDPMPYDTNFFDTQVEFMSGGEKELQPLLSLNLLRVEFCIEEENINFLRCIFPKVIKFTTFVNRDLTHIYY